MNPDAVSSVSHNANASDDIPLTDAEAAGYRALLETGDIPPTHVGKLLRWLDVYDRVKLAEQAQAEVPAEVVKPFKYGLTKTRARDLTSKRLRYPHYSREIHVWSVAYTAPYTTQVALADACTEDSELSLRTWQRVVGAMVDAGMLVLRAGGYVPAGDLTSVDRPQTSKTAKRNLAGKIHRAEPGHRDPSAKANRVRRVMRLGARAGEPYSSLRSLAVACSKNGSGSVREYQRVVARMYGNELVYDEACYGFGGDTLRLVPDYEI